MFGNHLWDLLPLIILALLFFGPKKLPEIGSSVGKTIKEFQKSMREVQEPERPQQPTVTATETPQLPPASAQQSANAATEAKAPEVSAS